MSKKRHREYDEDSEFQVWFGKTWGERETFLRQTFGPTDPPGYVTSFSWDDWDLVIPGGCALTFPPEEEKRPHWLFLTHGLTQPANPSEAKQSSPSGYGFEFAFITLEKADWPVQALYQILTYLKQDGTRIDIGHRVPLWFQRDETGKLLPILGVPDSDSNPANEMRWLVFWLYANRPSRFITATGYFWILVATTITQEEWELARETSSPHLLLLLSRMGIGQISQLDRSSGTRDTRWEQEWHRIRSLTEDEAQIQLQTFERAL